MATVSSTTTQDEIKKDVWELAVTALEDEISKHKIEYYRSWSELKHKDRLEEILKRDLMVSYITHIYQVSSRFVDKLLSVLPKYQHDEERRLIFHCVYLIVDEAERDRYTKHKVEREQCRREYIKQGYDYLNMFSCYYCDCFQTTNE
jgi:hypothetical protein